MSNEQGRQWNFSLARSSLAVAFLGVALACWRVLASLYESEENAIYAATLVVVLISAASTAIGVVVETAWKWALVGFLVAMPLAIAAAVLFYGADV